ncbi:hypothetical protein AGR7B_Lc50326 [Agrobacterium deltaense RV3]|nr:hypothetical protein AGR7B_Lc50326 [Agrobacterium deltaense RV3]
MTPNHRGGLGEKRRPVVLPVFKRVMG